ncbi:uncharacterized protein LOC115043413 [Echeneis naucrates]|uniref:uncharacterized protein LOC115043413 n=1 Tax=Echeneis naucrates TaxID=173247 RepID=UPI0011144F9F|nr:uncharacterized protein LOC115043413 [Echeneis naucrates]
MEEAYSELYQEFLRLRSLCLRQAALLHQLTSALQKQEGVAVPNREPSDMMSIPVQCTQELPVFSHDNPQPLKAKAQHGVDCALARSSGTLSDLIAEEISKLHVDLPLQPKEARELDEKFSPMLFLDSPRWNGAPSSKSGQTDHPGRHKVVHTAMAPLSEDPSLNLSGGMLMSDVVLQSHVCDFCQAIFPRNTTTRGAFLQHLHTHIT